MALNTITYSDKADINVNANVPDINKVKADDMNEIKTVVNASVNQTNGLTGQILWTNNSPTADFGAQTINFSSSDYDMTNWIFKVDKDSGELVSITSIKGYGVRVTTVSGDGINRRRTANYVSDTSYNLSNGIKADGTDQPSVLVLLYVIGYKTGLF